MEADVVELAEGNTAAGEGRASARATRMNAVAPPGSKSGARARGSSRNLGGLVVSDQEAGTAERRQRSDAGRAARIPSLS